MVDRSPNFDWSILATLLTSSSPIPSDIKFKVVDKEDGLVTVFQAHKFIFGLHSDHFNNVFFGSGVNFKEKEDCTVVIKDATKEAFEDFLGFNYEKNIEFEKKTLRELYDILNLAERYQVKELRDVVCDSIQKFPLSVRIQFESATTVEEFSQFDDASQALFASRVAFTKTQFTNVDSGLTFVQRHDDETTAMKPLKDEKMSEDCSNCREKPCYENSHILINDLLVSDMMVRTTEEGWALRCREKLGRVVSRKSRGRIPVSWSIQPAPSVDSVAIVLETPCLNMLATNKKSGPKTSSETHKVHIFDNKHA